MLFGSRFRDRGSRFRALGFRGLGRFWSGRVLAQRGFWVEVEFEGFGLSAGGDEEKETESVWPMHQVVLNPSAPHT